MTDPVGEQAAWTAEELEKLPPFRGLTFRGVPLEAKLEAGALETTVATVTSRDPRIATENFTLPRLLAIATRTGRAVGNAEHEIVLAPGSALMPVAEIRIKEAELVVRLVEELDRTGGTPDNTGLPPNLQEFFSEVSMRVLQAYRRDPLPDPTPGKFAGDLA